ncbi:c-type cytochrome [bacterium]|nr:c-type cytochrome [bacterium]
MKKLLTCALLLVVVLAAGAVLAEEKAEATAEMKPLAEMEGIEIYRNVCKACHGADGPADEYTPMSLIMEQWDEFFQDTFVETHQDVACPKDDTRKVTDVIQGDVLEKVHEFCVDHAADSEQPMTCG